MLHAPGVDDCELLISSLILQEAWRQLLGSQKDFLSAIALMAQAVGSTDPVLQRLYIRIAECQSMLQQLAQLLMTHAMMNASMASELSGSPLCAHLVRPMLAHMQKCWPRPELKAVLNHDMC